MKSKSYLWYQWWLGLLFNVCDYYITKYYVLKVSIEGEANPVQYYIMDHFGIAYALYVKLFLWIMLGIGLLFVESKRYVLLGKVLQYMNIILGCVIGWSLFCYFSV
jgi:hypothetical protein